MNERVKIFVLVAILGFVAGIIAELTAEYVLPALLSVLPAFLSSRVLLSGLAGALLTLGLVSVWAYMTGPRDR
jgi:hypothetical protein